MAKAPKKRGVVYMVFNKTRQLDEVMRRSIQSVYKHHPELGIHIEEIGQGSLLDKATMFERSPFEETVFLDLDTVVLGKLDFGFEMALKHHVAMALCEAPLARRYMNTFSDDSVEYNTGVIFFTKSEPAAKLFAEWKRLAPITDSSIKFIAVDGTIGVMPSNDQGSFAKAVRDTGFNPFVLPMNWNFRPLWQRSVFGPIKIWHDYSNVPQDVLDFNAAQGPGAVLGFFDVPVVR